MANADWTNYPRVTVALNVLPLQSITISSWPIVTTVIPLKYESQVDIAANSYPMVTDIIPLTAVHIIGTLAVIPTTIIALEYNSKPIKEAIISSESIRIVPLGGYVFGVNLNPQMHWG